ncbi:hypothetical protein QBC43DRAFT_292731 [Cladorrhinum sp. PSN259]|nr:hypothetical protein QBC43DRAFT_292731 [Cladorrhinum sp. PSN259]
MVQMSQQQSTMIDILGRIDHATQNLGQSVLTIPQLRAAPNSASASEMAVVNAIWNSTWTPKQPLTEIVPATLGTANFGTPEDERDRFSTVSIIDSLLFEGFNHRETSIPQSYRRTFEWIFHPPAHGAKWSDFDEWLREQESEVYWITGKAGAGKSTLMKHLIPHPTTKKRLEAWSNPLPLVTGSFYFWNAGSVMQKSPEGFLPILLYQFLCQVPRLTPKLLPRRWALFKIFGSNALKVAPKWAMEELLEAISIFTTVYVGTELRLGLFIDGLDEIDGDYKELIRLIRLFHNRSGAKVCVSSRPENAFTDEYETNPSLRVQDLTRPDMESYINGHFGANKAFRQLQSAFWDEADLLKRNIVEKSEGVFLWLSLVVATLLEGLTEGDIQGAKDLQTALDELPKDLSELYQRIWTRIKPTYIVESSKIFQILLASVGPLDAVNLWSAESQEPLDIPAANTPASHRRVYIHQLMRRRLSSRTRGLLEISPDGHVDYLHRSVWDWIRPMWDGILRKTPPEFDPNLALLVAATVNDLQVTNAAAKRELEEDDRDYMYEYRRNMNRQEGWGLSKKPNGVRRTLIALSQKLLTYASRVREHQTNIPVLITCLDRLGSVLENTIALYIHAVCDISEPTMAGKKIRLYHSGPAYPMVCLAAAWSVGPYVKTKVLKKQSILEDKYPDFLSVLGYAVFGASYIPLCSSPQRSALLPTALETRYELVRFLLGQGAIGPPKFYKKNSYQIPPGAEQYIEHGRVLPRAEHYGWAVYNEVKMVTSYAGRRSLPFSAVDGEHHGDYFKAVQKLFEDNAEIKRWKGPMGLLPRAVNHLIRNL